MRYDYKCENCHAIFEVEQRVIENPLTECKDCNGKIYRIFLEAPYAIIEQEPKTVGQLADRNRKKMGKYELETKELVDGVPEAKAKREVNEHRKKLNKMTAKQKEKYIMEGK